MSRAYRFILQGSQQVPSVSTAASGFGTAIFDSSTNTLSYSMAVNGLDWGPFLTQTAETAGTADNVTDAHFHAGARGANGGVILGWKGDDDFSASAPSGGTRQIAGLWETTDTSSISSHIATLNGGVLGQDISIYANIHTAGFGSGELRGQLVTIATDASETVTGTTNNDLLPGLDGNDTINGLDGDDVLIGGAGTDILDGGIGTDTADYSAATTVAVLHLDTPTQYGQYGSGAGGAIETDTLISIENLIGGSGADYLYGSSAANRLVGNAENDYIDGGYGNDTIDAGSGRDLVLASYDQDTVNGGADNDVIYGGADDDTLSGDAGNDLLYGDHGVDALFGGSGIDALFIDSTDVTFDGGADIDYIVWQDVTVAANLDITAHSADYFYGFTGGDTVTAVGATTRAELHGGGGDDILSGSAGVGSILLGEANNDILVGNTGIDHFVGGANIDVFVISANGGTDYIYDFGVGGADKVRFSSVPGVDDYTDLNVITTHSSGGWYGYSYGSGTVWLNTLSSGIGQPAIGDFEF